MTSTEPNSSTTISAMIWEIDASADVIFGASPYLPTSTIPPVGSVYGKLLADVFDYMRQSIWPMIFDSANRTKIQIVYKSQSIDPSDILNVTTVENDFDIFGVIMGASATNIESGLVIATDFECLVAANDLISIPTAKRDGVKFNGVQYDIIGILPLPSVPPAIGYRLFLRRAV